MKIFALVLFALMYVLMIAKPKYRPFYALSVAVIFLISGILPLENLGSTINWNVLLMIAGMRAFLETETDKTENLQRFLDKVKKLTEIKELTPELIHEFIDRIVVYAPKYLDGKRYQVVDVCYSGVGILRELSPEEMEETFQNRLAKQAQGKEIPT